MTAAALQYHSTRGAAPTLTAGPAIAQGLAPDGGLYVPAALPTFEVPAAPEATEEVAVAPAAPEAVAAPEAPVVAVAETGGAAMTADKIDALPFVAQLPFLLFRN